MTNGCSAESGTCATCQAGCTRKPGWFLPGEAEKTAELLGLTLEEFFAKYLAVDWYESYPDDIFLLSPAVAGEATGEEFPGDPRGTCVFYVEGRCQIHEAKPYECRTFWCGAPGSGGGGALTHQQVGEKWAGQPQEQVKELLGREPMATEFEGGPFGLGGW